MRGFIEIMAVILLSQQCTSLPLEETVVSVYTTHPTTMGTNPPIDVYHQIANNIAERITSPIFKFLGINGTKPEDTTKLEHTRKPEHTTKLEDTTKSVGKIELQDDQDLTSKHDIKPIDNDISKGRDVEELSDEALNKKTERKPEKIILYSSYLPTKVINSERSSRQEVEARSDTSTTTTTTTTLITIDDSFSWDDEEVAKPKEGPLVYVLELFGSLFQLVWGGLVAFFKPKTGINTN